MDDYVSKIEGSERITKMVPALQKQNYRLIIIDLPAISENISALKSAENANGTILVIEAEKVRREVVSRIKSQLDNFNVNMVGVILNKRNFYIPKWLYR